MLETLQQLWTITASAVISELVRDELCYRGIYNTIISNSHTSNLTAAAAAAAAADAMDDNWNEWSA